MKGIRGRPAKRLQPRGTIESRQARVDLIRKIALHVYWRDKHEARLAEAIREGYEAGLSAARLSRYANCHVSTIRRRYLGRK